MTPFHALLQRFCLSYNEFDAAALADVFEERELHGLAKEIRTIPKVTTEGYEGAWLSLATNLIAMARSAGLPELPTQAPLYQVEGRLPGTNRTDALHAWMGLPPIATLPRPTWRHGQKVRIRNGPTGTVRIGIIAALSGGEVLVAHPYGAWSAGWFAREALELLPETPNLLPDEIET